MVLKVICWPTDCGVQKAGELSEVTLTWPVLYKMVYSSEASPFQFTQKRKKPGMVVL